MSGLPSASGARISGDDYQHLFAWLQALSLLRESDCVERIVLEARQAGNVDDVVVYRAGGRPNLYHQVKFVVDHREHLTHEWFTTKAKNASKTPLQRFYDSFEKLSSDAGRPQMALVTNRPKDPNDPVLKLTTGRHGLLMPRLGAAAAGSAAGKIRAAWAAELDIGEEDLLEMLSHLEIRAGSESFAQLQETCGWAMEALGLRGDLDAVETGMSEMRRLVAEGCDELDAEALRRIIAAKQLAGSATRATLLIQAIERHPWPDSATASLDWVDLFEGDEPRTRRQLRDPSQWNERLRVELRDAVARIREQGYESVLIEGALRLSTWFFVGSELADVARFKVALRTRDGVWTSEAEEAAYDIEPEPLELGRGDELAVGLSVTGDLTNDVKAHIEDAGLPIRTLLNVKPTVGASQTALPGPGEALAWARDTLAAVRGAMREHSGTVHLFMYCPASAALFLGHVWNRVPRTQLYDDIVAGGYAPTFVVEG